MTKVNLAVPFFQTSLPTNNSQIVIDIITQKYGFSNCHVFWINSSQEKDAFQCVVKVDTVALGMDDLLNKLQKAQRLQQTMAKMKIDIFNMIKKYEQVMLDRKTGLNLQKMKEFVGNEIQDSEVSLKIEERDRLMGRERDLGLSEQQYMSAISQLTRENIKLKDALIYYQAQMQAFVRSNQQSLEKREKNK